jgi:hypothetical protein
MLPNWLSERDMSPKGYQRALRELGLNQTSAGALMGYSARQSRRFAQGDSEIPPCPVLLLRALCALGIRFPKPKRKPRRPAVVAQAPPPTSP